MAAYGSHFWKKTPFLKLLISLIAGIIIQWHLQIAEGFWWLFLILGIVSLLFFFTLPVFKRFNFSYLSGIATGIIFISFGALLIWHKDIRNNGGWLGNSYKENDALVVTLDEPTVEKTKSFKANATVSYLLKDGNKIPVKGKIILYFRKDSSFLGLGYGTQILFKKPLQEIKNSGNPGGFDYKRYSLFQGITHQVFMKGGEFEILPGKKETLLKKWIYSSRERVLNILRNNIHGEKELGLSEALLIGYKNDLDQSLVQSYTNTGVVHIIAISGLHLGLIYWLLVQLLSPLRKNKKTKWLRPVLIIVGLWSFSFLAGAQPSVLRSALMFSCIVLGESFSRRSSIYNTMAISAFLLLCFNPFWLWDVGFQLSYAAVLSIIIFMRPIYNWFYIKNKMLDFIWKMNAVTIAAQILTVPLSIYHFHQFPNYFLLTNFLAVPLSSIIVLGEILLCVVAFIPFIAALVGKALSWLIMAMNTYIERIETIPFSLWDGLQITIWQAVFLLFTGVGIAYWLMEKSKKGLIAGLLSLGCFTILRTLSFLEAEQQQKIIVYNVPQKIAIDFVDGRKYLFIGDSSLLANDFARNFHLKPSRILFRISSADTLKNFSTSGNYINYYGHHILIIDKSVSYLTLTKKFVIDLLVIAKKPGLNIANLAKTIDIKQVVFDGTVPAWKAGNWKKDCDSLQIPWHDVTTHGAFVMNLR